jgi:hypothetical protein
LWEHLIALEVGENFLVFNLIQIFNTKQLVHTIAKGLGKATCRQEKKLNAGSKKWNIIFIFIFSPTYSHNVSILSIVSTLKEIQRNTSLKLQAECFVCRQFNTG